MSVNVYISYVSINTLSVWYDTSGNEVIDMDEWFKGLKCVRQSGKIKNV